MLRVSSTTVLALVLVCCVSSARAGFWWSKKTSAPRTCEPKELQQLFREKCDVFSERTCRHCYYWSSRQECEKKSWRACAIEVAKINPGNTWLKNTAIKHDILEEDKAARYCRNWSDEQKRNQSQTTLLFAVMDIAPCPQTAVKVRLSECFAKDKSALYGPWLRTFHPYAKTCYRSKGFRIDDNLRAVANQCCYDDNDQLLPGEHSGAGTVDSAAAEVDGARHTAQDVIPYLACCSLSHNCHLYNQLRPRQKRMFSDAQVDSACSELRRSNYRVTQDTLPWWVSQEVRSLLTPAPTRAASTKPWWQYAPKTTTQQQPTTTTSGAVIDGAWLDARLDECDALPESEYQGCIDRVLEIFNNAN